MMSQHSQLMSLRIVSLERQLSIPLPAPQIEVLRRQGTLDVQDFYQVGFGPHHLIRNKAFKMVLENRAVFRHPHYQDLDREDQRRLTYQQVKFYLEHMPVGFQEFHQDPRKATILSNTMYCVNPNMSLVLGVHYLLYIKTLYNLGTDKHAEFRRRAVEWKDIGCFALTELTHGSNVKGIMTEAHYCHQTRTFIIHSPTKDAMKFWIGASANVATITIVWAQLYIRGQCHGVHAYIVPLRDTGSRDLLPGVLVGDCGPKMGLHGVDNGFIMFDKVRIPKQNQLDLLSGVDENGDFASKIKGSSKRFGVQLGTLSSGRTTLLWNVLGLSISALAIAIRYTLERKQFSPPKSSGQILIFDYPLTKYRMMTLLAQAVVYHFGGLLFSLRSDTNVHNILDSDNAVVAQLHALSSVLKAKASWFTSHTIGECRQMLGGHGYSQYSRLGALFNDNQVNTTFEGDNNILIMQAAKYVLDGSKKFKQGKQVPDILSFLRVDSCVDEASESNLKSLAYLETVFSSEIKKSLIGVEDLFARQVQKGTSLFQIWNLSQIHHFKQIAMLFGDYFYIQASKATLHKFKSQRNKQVYLDCALVWAWKTLDSSHYGDDDTKKLIRGLITQYCQRIAKESVRILDALAPPSDIIGSPFADQHGDGMRKYYNLLYSGKDTFRRVDWYQTLTQNPSRTK